ncbi:MAG: alpha-amylase family glycosyl hydrolase, partial [Ginsengibacter sp.]
TSVTLVLYAPSKTRVNVIGEFPNSNWLEQSDYQMNQTPDGNRWWITITGLVPGQEYSYQYLVDGKLVIADPYAEKILDPWNDKYILPTTYPNLKAYPENLTSGIVSVLQTAKPAYTWTTTGYQRPDKRNLVIYELLVRDFVATHDWKTLKDTINYLKNLGINAIELMPLNEFEGNESWGYNPNFYFAPDKYYGPENTLKAFIDECHKNGIAVIMDIALNHSFGSSPMVQLYWDANNNRPASNNPWFNTVPKHAFNVGYDINHDKPETKYYVSRIVDHWLSDYKIDGFRFDLSKGFTQKQTCDANGNNCDVGAWSAYDAGRIAIWKGYYDTLQLKSSNSYVILEHFADNSEETELSNYGMLLWGNSNHTYSQASMGYQSESDFSYGFANVRNWTNPYLINYMESHDEERVMFNDLSYGNSSGSYNIKNLNTALKRQELTAAFFFTIPGPKMVWQFGEVGYDFSINYCPDGTNSTNCRVDNKPIHWDYLQNTNRKQLYDVYSKLIKLRNNPLFKDVFVTNITNQNLGGLFKSIVLSANVSKIVVIGNFDVATQTGSVTFPSGGVWYDYLNNTTINATGSPQSFTLQPGEYHVYTSVDAALPVTILSFEGRKISNSNILTWEVADEVNLASYELERSYNGKDFLMISKTEATGLSKYSYTDIDAPSSGITYYRLKSVDKDGKFQYSLIVKIQRNTTLWQVQATPNPFVNTLKIKLESPIQDKVKIIISDMSGRQLFNKGTSISTGTNWIEMNETASFSKGTYLVSIISSTQTETLKVVKVN